MEGSSYIFTTSSGSQSYSHASWSPTTSFYSCNSQRNHRGGTQNRGLRCFSCTTISHWARSKHLCKHPEKEAQFCNIAHSCMHLLVHLLVLLILIQIKELLLQKAAREIHFIMDISFKLKVKQGTHKDYRAVSVPIFPLPEQGRQTPDCPKCYKISKYLQASQTLCRML